MKMGSLVATRLDNFQKFRSTVEQSLDLLDVGLDLIQIDGKKSNFCPASSAGQIPRFTIRSFCTACKRSVVNLQTVFRSSGCQRPV